MTLPAVGAATSTASQPPRAVSNTPVVFQRVAGSLIGSTASAEHRIEIEVGVVDICSVNKAHALFDTSAMQFQDVQAGFIRAA